ncbi:MAG: twin-arginine translocase TatA/TatE family subunit, partial [Streptosporangiaceae bacterium]
MFGDVGWGEVLVLIVLALFIFGPERLPKLASDLAKGLRQVRRMATNAKNELQDNLGPEYKD